MPLQSVYGPCTLTLQYNTPVELLTDGTRIARGRPGGGLSMSPPRTADGFVRNGGKTMRTNAINATRAGEDAGGISCWDAGTVSCRDNL